MITIVFLVLTAVTGAIVVGVAMDSMDPPIFVPPTDIPPATQMVIPTLTPSPSPAELTQQAPTATPGQ